ncbi:MAG TPA: ABC transporter permease [Gammaproteobacteria bacterium]|nr:ABC transporter permease [Gammaproteobacteria bacterium]
MDREKFLKLLPWISTPLLLLAIFAIWKLYTTVSGISEFVIPTPEAAWASLVDLVLERETWTVHVWITLFETLVGFAIAVVTGVAVGAVLGRIYWLELALRPIIVALQVIPKVALIPIFVILFGFGVTSKVIIAAILAFFPIMLNVMLGVRSVDPGHREVMRSLDAGRWQTFRHLDFHSILPYLFAGMEVGIVFALIGAIVGEYLGANEGLGNLVVVSLNDLDAPQLFAVIILLAALGSVLYFAVSGVKRLMIPWHESVIRE